MVLYGIVIYYQGGGEGIWGLRGLCGVCVYIYVYMYVCMYIYVIFILGWSFSVPYKNLARVGIAGHGVVLVVHLVERWVVIDGL